MKGRPMPKEISIEYCTAWGYLKSAVSLAAEILEKHKMNVVKLIIQPSDGGRFEIAIDGELVFSKMETNRFPEHDEILAHLG